MDPSIRLELAFSMTKAHPRLERAQSLMKEERWRDALELLKENSFDLEKNWELLWNLGWCYFKLERLDEARKYLTRASHLVPKSYACRFALGCVYLGKKQYNKAESILSLALQAKESYIARIGLALAFLAQGKIQQAENTHLDGIKLKPRDSERYAAYADFLSDVGRKADAEKMNRKAKELRRVN
jgi:Tfp pilus assembly protein PilF